MKKIWIVLFIISAVSLTAFGQLPTPPTLPQAPPAPPPPPPPPATGKWWKNSAIVRELGLSEAQVAQLESVYLQHQPRLAGLRSALIDEENRLKKLLASDPLDERTAAAQIQAVNSARAALQTENSEMTLNMRRIVTGEQWAKLDKMKSVLPLPPLPPLPPPPPPLRGKRVVYDMSTPGIQEPQITYRTSVPYTAEARQARVEGTILIEAVFESDGTISYVRVLRGIGYGMDEAAVRTLRTWKFTPGKLNGQPVSVRVNVEMSVRPS